MDLTVNISLTAFLILLPGYLYLIFTKNISGRRNHSNTISLFFSGSLVFIFTNAYIVWRIPELFNSYVNALYLLGTGQLIKIQDKPEWVSALLVFCLVSYFFAIIFGLIIWFYHQSGIISYFTDILYRNKTSRLAPESALEQLLFRYRFIGVKPEIKIITPSGKEIQGYCWMYTLASPKELVLQFTEKVNEEANEDRLIWIKVQDINNIVFLNPLPEINIITQLRKIKDKLRFLTRKSQS